MTSDYRGTSSLGRTGDDAESFWRLLQTSVKLEAGAAGPSRVRVQPDTLIIKIRRPCWIVS